MSGGRRALVIVIDAARREALYEAFDASDMPVLQDMARATLIAPSCWTVPCVASMLTGLFPSRHGLQWPLTSTPPATPTIADMLETDERTFRLLSGNNLCGSPLLPLRDDQVYLPHDRWRPALASARIFAGMDYGSQAITREVRRMATDNALPDVMMVHLQEAHHPYLAPPRGLSPIPRLRYAFGHLEYYLTSRARAWQFAAVADSDDWAGRRARYHECIEYTVAAVEDLLGIWKRAGLLEDSLVIITADHGEHLGEHGLADHQASLHEELVNCPCALLAPGISPGTQLAGQFQHTDLLHTICRYLDVPTDGYTPGRAPRDMLAADAQGHAHAFMEWAAWGEDERARLQRHNPGYDFEALARDLTAVRTERWKYIRGTDGSEALYDLQQDPGEMRNVADAFSDVAARLSIDLDHWVTFHRLCMGGVVLSVAVGLLGLWQAPATASVPRAPASPSGR